MALVNYDDIRLSDRGYLRARIPGRKVAVEARVIKVNSWEIHFPEGLSDIELKTRKQKF